MSDQRERPEGHNTCSPARRRVGESRERGTPLSRGCRGNAPERSCGLEPLRWQESDLNALVEGFCNALQHGEGMTVVIGVFKAADGRSGSTDLLREFALAQSGLGAEVVNFTGDLRIENFLFLFRDPLRVGSNVAVVEVLNGACLKLSFGGLVAHRVATSVSSHTSRTAVVCGGRDEG